MFVLLETPRRLPVSGAEDADTGPFLFPCLYNVGGTS